MNREASRTKWSELAPLLTYEGTVEVELASGMVIEAAVYSGMTRFDGQELTAKLRKTCRRN